MANTPASAFGIDDESAVRTIVSEFANTWNRHDVKTMHELDTEDGRGLTGSWSKHEAPYGSK